MWELGNWHLFYRREQDYSAFTQVSRTLAMTRFTRSMTALGANRDVYWTSGERDEETRL